jgi:hypothetical protein
MACSPGVSRFALVVAMGVASATSVRAIAQVPAGSQLATAEKIIETYKLGETTLDQFFADGWTAGDIFRGKAGIFAYRFSAEDHAFSFVVGACEGLGQSPTMATGLDQAMQILKSTGSSFSSNWASEFDITVPTGDGVRCTKSHYLKFADSKLLQLRDLRITQ